MCAIASVNAEHGAIRTVSRIARTTQIAVTTARVYLTNNTMSDKRAVSAFFNDADELMSNRSIETGIAARYLEIRVADSRQQHTHQRLVSLVRLAYIFNCESFFINAEGEHTFGSLFFVLCALPNTKYQAQSTEFRRSYFACKRSAA